MLAIFYIGIAQSIFSGFVLFSRPGKTRSDIIMAIWMLAIGFELFHMLIDLNQNPWFLFTSNFSFISLTFGPFLYLYVNHRLNENLKINAWELIHFLPYLILSFIHLFFFTGKPMRSVDYDFSNGFFLLSITKISLLFLSLIIYSYLVIRILVRHQKRIKDTYSFSSGKITFTWLKYITLVFILTYFSLIVFFLLDNDNSLGFSSHYIPAIGLTIISFSLTYYILMQPAFSFEDGTGPKENLYTSGLDQNRTITMKKNLISFMENEKPFLEPELSIQHLADKVRIPRHYLTFLINEELHKNFFSFINEYRVEKAKSLLADPQYQDDTVLSVGLNSGFNSKSSFNAIFKQNTSFTPTEYRKKFIKT